MINVRQAWRRLAGREAGVYALLLGWAAGLVLGVEVLSRGWGSTAAWAASGSVALLGLNMLIALCLLLLLTALTASLRLSLWAASIGCIAFGLLSGIKLRVWGIPFQPWDWLRSDAAHPLAPHLTELLSVKHSLGLAALAAIGLLLLRRLSAAAASLRLSGKRRLLGGLAACLALASIYSNGPFTLKRLAHVQDIVWDQSDNVSANGLLLTTVMNIRYARVPAPEGYNEAAIRELAGSVPPAVTKPDDIKPNVLVVLGESFWDPTQIEGLAFSRDPIPFFHRLAAGYSSGTLLSPQFGGSTANVEFEVLTGNSMRFLPENSVPYNQYIYRRVDSLAGIFARQGYASTIIVPYYSWFFNAKDVYRNFGFSRFISGEFFEPDYEGPNLADRGVAKEIIKMSEATPGPDFIFASTMENHYEFNPGKFKANTIRVTGVTGEAQGMLETLAQGMSGTDAMLESLVDYYTRRSEPTIIVFFGDHLPKLGNDYEAYRETGYLKPDDPDFLDKMYRTPVVVWNNYLPPRRDRLDMSPSFLGPYVLKLAGRPGTYYTDYLSRQAEATPVIPPKSAYAKLGIAEERLSGYERLQYDILFGAQYGYQERGLTVVDPNFALGAGSLHIERVTADAAGGSRRLTVEGRHLPPLGIVLVNGEALPAERSEDGRWSVALDSSFAPPYRVEMVVKDAKNKIIARSNAYTCECRAAGAAN